MPGSWKTNQTKHAVDPHNYRQKEITVGYAEQETIMVLTLRSEPPPCRGWKRLAADRTW